MIFGLSLLFSLSTALLLSEFQQGNPLVTVDNITPGKKNGFVITPIDDSLKFTHTPGNATSLSYNGENIEIGPYLVEQALNRGSYGLLNGKGASSWWSQFGPKKQLRGTNWICVASNFAQNPESHPDTIEFGWFFATLRVISQARIVGDATPDYYMKVIDKFSDDMRLPDFSTDIEDYPDLGIPSNNSCFRVYTKQDPVGLTLTFGQNYNNDTICDSFETKELRYYIGRCVDWYDELLDVISYIMPE